MLNLIILVSLAATLPLTAAVTRPVAVEGGRVLGLPGKDPSITTFKGIPFAAPPVGDLRWRDPKPVVAWTGVRRVEKFAPSCIQNIVTEKKPWTYEFMAHGDVSEDCLYLNVWTGAKSSSERRPVFLYIYGGAFNEGSASVPVYDGEGLAKKGLVVVTINYRVGVLGFLTHPELSRESEHHVSGNYGLLDTIAALRWVHQNIARFGGDPGKVTIAGQSAGGTAVHDLIGSPLAKGLFHRAIVESGSATTGPVLAVAETNGQKFAEAKGAKSLAALRAMTWQSVVEPLRPALRFGPVLDGYTFLLEKQNDVPLLTGVNSGELSPQAPVSAQAFRDRALQRFGADADQFLKLYPAATGDQAVTAQRESARDQALVLIHHAAAGRIKTYEYLWDHPPPGPDAAQYGAFHTSEVPYVLNTLYMSDRPFTDTDRKIAEMMSSYWANFAATGDPNGKGLPPWPAVTDKSQIMELGDHNQPIPLAETQARIDFFETFLTRPK